MQSKLLRSWIAVTISLALSVVQIASPARAQSPDDAVAKELDEAATSDLQRTEERLSRLEKQIKKLQQQNLALESALATTTSALKDKIADEVAALKSKAEKSAKEASKKFEDALKGMAENTLGGDWIEGKSPQEVLELIAKSREAAEALQDRVKASRTALDNELSGSCSSEMPESTAGLSALYPAPERVPQKWTAEVVFRAKSNNLTLPPCVAGAKDKAGNPLADQYYKDQLAAQQSAAAMNAMMMMALSTGNPYVIAAAMALMVLLAILSDSGSGGGGKDGNSEGENGGGKTAKATEEGNGERDGKDVKGNKVNSPQPTPGTYANVEPGLDVEVFVDETNQTITLRNTKDTSIRWFFKWDPPKSRKGDKEYTLPPFNSTMRIISANLEKDTNKSSMRVKLKDSKNNCEGVYTIRHDAGRGYEIVAEPSDDNRCL